MKKVVGAVILVLCLFAVRLEAQETVSVGWPSRETKQEVSHSVPVGMTANDPNSVRLASSVVPKNGLKDQNNMDTRPPFPVSIPVKIDYPRKAIRRGWEGQTVVAAEILPDGSVGRTALAKSSGHEVLDSAANDAIKTWKFGTESEKEDTVPQYVDIPVTFKLEDHGE